MYLSSLTVRVGGLDSFTVKAPCDGGGGWVWSTPFFLHGSFVSPSLPPPIFSLILVSSYHLLACGLTCPVTHLLSPQDFVKQVFTRNRLLYKADLVKYFRDYLRHKAESQPDCLHTYYTGICLFLWFLGLYFLSVFYFYFWVCDSQT